MIEVKSSHNFAYSTIRLLFQLAKSQSTILFTTNSKTMTHPMPMIPITSQASIWVEVPTFNQSPLMSYVDTSNTNSTSSSMTQARREVPSSTFSHNLDLVRSGHQVADDDNHFNPGHVEVERRTRVSIEVHPLHDEIFGTIMAHDLRDDFRNASIYFCTCMPCFTCDMMWYTF